MEDCLQRTAGADQATASKHSDPLPQQIICYCMVICKDEQK